MSIPPRFLDEIRNRLSLSEIIGNRIKVTRAGREFKACCPFHHEKTPSFTINDDKQFYHCFGCGAHGDVIGFVMQHDNLSFPDAVETLAGQAGLQMPKPDPEAMKKAERHKDLHTLLESATAWMQGQIDKPEHKDVQTYINERGLGGDARSHFRIGYAPANGQALRSYMRGQGYDDAMMMEAGLLKKSTKGGDPYVFFRDRVMFPVADRRGRIVAYGGRILPEHIRPQTNPNFTPPKYINSSDTPLFDKGRMLYGESHARQAAREGHSIIVTEGYMDVIAAHQAGFKGAVAPMGTALTEDQILSLWSMIPADEKIPVLCFDGDNAGRSAASRACQRILPLLAPNQSVNFAFLPDGEDPDSILRSGGALAFKSVLQAALPLFDFLWASHTAGRKFETPEQRGGLEKTMYNEIAQIKDANIQRHYKELIRSKVSETFFARNNKWSSGGKTQTHTGQAMPRMKKPTAGLRLKKPRAQGNRDIQDRILLAAVLNYPHIYEAVEDAFGSFNPASPRLDSLRQSIIMMCEEVSSETPLDSTTLRHHLEEQGYTQEVGDILSESVYVHAAFCRPAVQSDSPETTHSDDTAQRWLEFWRNIEGQGFDQEIRAGWRQAYENANEDDEKKLRHLLHTKISEE